MARRGVARHDIGTYVYVYVSYVCTMYNIYNGVRAAYTIMGHGASVRWCDTVVNEIQVRDV